MVFGNIFILLWFSSQHDEQNRLDSHYVARYFSIEVNMRSNQMIIIGVIFAALLLIAPSIAIPIGNHYQKKLDSDDVDRVSVWRSARFFYRISKFSPFFWSHSSSQIRETDLKLSNSMFDMIIEGFLSLCCWKHGKVSGQFRNSYEEPACVKSIADLHVS